MQQLPQKIFTVQDEPPAWDDDDEAGLESVSEPEMEDLADGMGETALLNVDGDEADTTVEADTIAPWSRRRAGRVDEDAEWETRVERGWTPYSQPILVERPSSDVRKDRPAVAMRSRTESWVETGREGYEAPNGGRVK